MAKLHPFYEFPSNVPKALINAYIGANRNCRKLARGLGINQRYVNEMMKGIEPKNPEIRAKLFLPRKPRKPGTPRPEEFPGQKKIKKQIALMAKNTRIELGMTL